jgi:hypothetical protein
MPVRQIGRRGHLGICYRDADWDGWDVGDDLAVLLSPCDAASGEEIYVRFQDDLANTSPEAAETSHPPTSPETAPFEVYLPMVVRK